MKIKSNITSQADIIVTIIIFYIYPKLINVSCFC